MKKITTIVFLMIAAFCTYAQNDKSPVTGQTEEPSQNDSSTDPDTTSTEINDDKAKTTELQELIVKSEYAWFEDGKAIFIPRKADKNLSNSITSLIDRMGTGILRTDQGGITTFDGQPVSIYINGVAVDELDEATFWPKNALRVEFMQSSNDPLFQGKQNILNIVMKDYVAGGLTKINASQDFPNNGSYSASSKLVWGKMTYQAIFKGGYSRDHLSGNERTESYYDVWYGGTHYDNISHYEKSEDFSRSNDIYGGFTARYRDSKIIATHGAALQWSQNPGSGSRGLSIYNPEIVSGNSMKSAADGHSLSPTVYGSYNWTGNPKWHAGGSWSFTHSHNDGHSDYEEGRLNPIVNNTRENRYSYSFSAYGNWTPRNNLFIGFNISEARSVSTALYTGSTVSDQYQNNGNTNFLFQFWYQPTNWLNISIKPQFIILDRNINHTIKTKQYAPGVNGILNFQLNWKNSLALYSWYWQTAPTASSWNDLILRQTELKWIEGNPSLKPSETYHVGLGYHTMPLSWLTSDLSLTFDTQNNQTALSYRNGGKEYEGVIGQYHNHSHYDIYNVIWRIDFPLLGNNLRFGHLLNYEYSKIDNFGKISHFTSRPYVGWTFGNCNLFVSYETPGKTFTNGGTEKIKTDHEYDLKFHYGNGNLFLSISLNNIFSKHRYTDHWYISGPYRFDSRSWSRGRNVSVMLTYTFDYGKKVDPSIDVDARNIRSTSVLGSN